MAGRYTSSTEIGKLRVGMGSGMGGIDSKCMGSGKVLPAKLKPGANKVVCLGNRGMLRVPIT